MYYYGTAGVQHIALRYDEEQMKRVRDPYQTNDDILNGGDVYTKTIKVNVGKVGNLFKYAAPKSFSIGPYLKVK